MEVKSPKWPKMKVFVELCSFLEALGDNLFSCLFQVLEATCTGSSPPYIFKTSRDQVFQNGSFLFCLWEAWGDPSLIFTESSCRKISQNCGGPYAWMPLEFLNLRVVQTESPASDWLQLKFFYPSTGSWGGFHCWQLFKDNYWTLWVEGKKTRFPDRLKNNLPLSKKRGENSSWNNLCRQCHHRTSRY